MAKAAVVTALVVGAGAGCSSSGSTASQASGATTTVADTADDTADGTCDDLELTGTVNNKAFTASSAAAVSLDGGKAYTLYVADFPVVANDLSMYSTPEPAADQTVFMIADTVFNAPDPDAVKKVAAGDTVTYTPDFGKRTFTVVASQGSESHGNNTGAKGTLTVTKAGDQFCGTISYSDDEKTIEGTFVAAVKDL